MIFPEYANDYFITFSQPANEVIIYFNQTFPVQNGNPELSEGGLDIQKREVASILMSETAACDLANRILQLVHAAKEPSDG